MQRSCPSKLATISILFLTVALVGCGKKAEAPKAEAAKAEGVGKAKKGVGKAKKGVEKPDDEAAAAPDDKAADDKAGEDNDDSDDNAASAAKGEQAEVTADGTNFDPPVEIANVPANAWYCDMGTVHFARMNEGDKRCPRCKMALKHKAAD